MCPWYATYSDLGAKQSKNPLFTELLLLSYFRGVLVPFGDFACLTIASFCPFPELLNQQNPNSSWPPRPHRTDPAHPGNLSSLTPPWVHLTSATLSSFLFSDITALLPASRSLHLRPPTFP